jgi:hypothetical protein
MLRALNCSQGQRYLELAEQRSANETFVYGWVKERWLYDYGMIIGLAALFCCYRRAFGIGHSRGTSKAEAKADQQRTEEKPLPLKQQQNAG